MPNNMDNTESKYCTFYVHVLIYMRVALSTYYITYGVIVSRKLPLQEPERFHRSRHF